MPCVFRMSFRYWCLIPGLVTTKSRKSKHTVNFWDVGQLFVSASIQIKIFRLWVCANPVKNQSRKNSRCKRTSKHVQSKAITVLYGLRTRIQTLACVVNHLHAGFHCVTTPRYEVFSTNPTEVPAGSQGDDAFLSVHLLKHECFNFKLDQMDFAWTFSLRASAFTTMLQMHKMCTWNPSYGQVYSLDQNRFLRLKHLDLWERT